MVLLKFYDDFIVIRHSAFFFRFTQEGLPIPVLKRTRNIVFSTAQYYNHRHILELKLISYLIVNSPSHSTYVTYGNSVRYNNMDKVS